MRAAWIVAVLAVGCGRFGFQTGSDSGSGSDRDSGSANTDTGAATDVGDPLQGLVAWYKLDDGAGMTATDSSPTGNNGSLASCGPPFPAWVAGKIGGGLHFDAASQNCVEVTDVPTLEIPGAWTVATWVELTSVPSPGSAFPLVVKPNAFSQHNYALFADRGHIVGNGWLVDFYDAVSTVHSVLLPVTFNTGVWTHLAGTWDGTTLALYVDGLPSGMAMSGAPPSATMYTGGALTLMGKDQCCTEFLDGALDDVRIYSRALSAAEIGALAN